MKIRNKDSTRHLLLFFPIFFAAFMWTAGCATKPHPDPLAGWQFSSLDNFDSIKAIKDDYEKYIQELPPKERNSHGPISFFDDGTGRHAIKFETGRNGTSWAHVLIYGKDNKRIKAIKYISGHYES